MVDEEGVGVVVLSQRNSPLFLKRVVEGVEGADRVIVGAGMARAERGDWLADEVSEMAAGVAVVVAVAQKVLHWYRSAELKGVVEEPDYTAREVEAVAVK